MLAENQPSPLNFPATGPFSSFSLCRGLQPPSPHHRPSHHHLHHKKPSNHHTWWLHRFSLSSTKFFFSATTTPAAATTSSRSFCPSYWKLGKQLSPQPLQQFQLRVSPLLYKHLLLLQTSTRASRQPHHLQSHRVPPIRPRTPSILGKPPSSFLLLPPFSVTPLVQLSHWTVLVTKLLWAGSSLSLKLKRRRRICWTEFGPTVLGQVWPFFSRLSSAQQSGPAQSTYICNILIYYILLLLYLKKSKKISMGILKYLWFSQMFFYQFCLILGCILTL